MNEIVEQKKNNYKVTKYSKKIVDAICNDLALGKSLRNVLSPVKKHRPCYQSFRLWLKKYPNLREQYENAKKDGAELLLAKAQDLLDETIENSKHLDKMDLGKTHLIKEYLNLTKWRCEKLLPKQYGKQNELNAKVGDEIIQIKWQN
tara:strand:+ start:185 stop:625 length:441 start_codon:yes stop_codon:yes gene_type:complete